MKDDRLEEIIKISLLSETEGAPEDTLAALAQAQGDCRASLATTRRPRPMWLNYAVAAVLIIALSLGLGLGLYYGLRDTDKDEPPGFRHALTLEELIAEVGNPVILYIEGYSFDKGYVYDDGYEVEYRNQHGSIIRTRFFDNGGVGIDTVPADAELHKKILDMIL
jgi:hypothetical protein